MKASQKNFGNYEELLNFKQKKTVKTCKSHL